MEGLTVFNEIFDKDPADPLDKTENDGGFHLNELFAHKGDDPVILKMYTDTKPKFDTFIVDKTLYDKNFGDLKLMNADFDAFEDGLNDIFHGYQRTIAVPYPPGTPTYLALFWENVTDMFKGGISKKIANINRFLLVLEDHADLVLIKTNLTTVKGTLNTKMQNKVILDAVVEDNLKTARASQKIFCIEEQGNAGGLMQFYKATPYVCNQYYNVTDIKNYQPTEGALAKKAALIHEFAPNTITVVPGVMLTPSCKPDIKNIGVEGVKLGSTYAVGVKGPALLALPPGKYYRKNIKFIGAVNNSYLVVDTMGNTVAVKLKIEIK